MEMVIKMIIKWLWRIAGFMFVGLAYLGIILPGVPTTIFAILAAYSFSKSSPKLQQWIYDHKFFGKHVLNWEKKKIFPNLGRRMMVTMMTLSSIILYLSTPHILVFVVPMFVIIIIWAYRYPGSEEEYLERIECGKKLGWLK
jgi:uncharacterized membrane protein YbaN (DUF454 family)